MNIREDIQEVNEDVIFITGYDEALIGFIEGAGTVPVAVYDKWHVIDLLALRYDCSRDDALDYFHHDFLGAYAGEGTPVFLTVLAEED